MQSILVTNYSYIVSRKTARLGLKYIDLESIKLRAKKGFRKRTSHSYSSRDIIHIGGYDKPKPFGTYVHGGIDAIAKKLFGWKSAQQIIISLLQHFIMLIIRPRK